MKNINHIVTGKSHEGFEAIDTTENKSGFFDLPVQKACNHPEHNPPQHICIPPGKGFRHICPKCKKATVIIPPQVSC